jgi:hypothetical protein
VIIPATTREDIDRNGGKTLSHRNFNIGAYLHYTKNDETIKIPMNHIVNKYKEYFDPYIVEVEMEAEDERRYRYSPKKLSMDTYQTTEYWSIILYINECHSIVDFTPEGYIKLIQVNKIEELLNEIMILEGLL